MRLSTISIMMALPCMLWAATAGDSVHTAKDETAYERRIRRYNQFWHSLTPDFVRFQYAGSVGLVNLGCGWAYGRRDKWETDLMLGFVTKYAKDKPFFTVTIRETFVPWEKHLKGHFSCQPLSCGLFLNSVLRKDYWTREPERYPERSYYKFSTKVRFHLFVGQRYSFNIPADKRFMAQKLSAVWEVSACDLYVLNRAVNKSLPWYEMFSLSLGLKYDF